MSSLLTRIADQTRQALRADACLLLLLEGDDLVFRAWAGLEDELTGAGRLKVHESLTGAVIREGHPLVCPDLAGDPVWRETPLVRQFGYRAMLAVPLSLEDRPIGVLKILQREPRPFPPGEVELLGILANQAALAVENARLLEAERTRAREIDALREIALEMTGALELEPLLRLIVRRAVELVRAHSGTIYLLDETGQRLIPRAWENLGDWVQDRVHRLGEGVSGRVALDRRGLIVNDYPQWPYRSELVLSHVPIQAVISAPLIIRDRLLGVVTLNAVEAGRSFQEEDLSLLSMLAAQAALAIHNAELFARERAARAEAEVSTQRQAIQFAVTRILAGAATFREGTSKLLQTICEGMGWDLGEMWLVDPDAALLRWHDSWHQPSIDAAEFEAISRGFTFPPGRGLPGRVWASGQATWVTDVVEDSNFPRSPFAASAGLHAAFAFAIRSGGDVVGVMVFFSRDVRQPDDALLRVVADLGSQIGQFAERKWAEEALRLSEEQFRQSQKMEAIGRLAGGVAHDFNNLLTIIKGRSALLLRRLNPADPMRRDLDLIQKTAERAAQLTRQLLAFGRKQVLQPKVLDLNAVVAEMGTMLRRLIGEDIALVTVPGPGLGRVGADPGQLEQALVNLAVNARDAMPEGGQLTIETANVELDEAAVRRHVGAKPGPYVLLRVSDTGCGMDAETRARLFEPFFTTKEPGKGTGLGLATVYGIVKQSEGYIWAESAPGQGATFTIYLPRVEAPLEAAAPPGKEPAGPARGSETVLLVEDEEGLRDLAREVLAASGYTVLEARHGGQALLIAEQYAGAIHLLLTDVVMPHMSGRELAGRLAPLRPDMRVLYMSGYTDDAIGRHGVLEPGTAFLPKPFTPEVLARSVREVLDGREPARPDAT